MKDIDQERVQKLLSSMRHAVSSLIDLRGIAEEQFLQNKHLQGSAKYYFIVAIESAIDLASHIISRKGLRAPEDYADTFRVLKEGGVIPEEFSVELEKMARFRNRLVHLYWDVDDKEIWNIIQTRLGDFETYLSFLGRYLGRDLKI